LNKSNEEDDMPGFSDEEYLAVDDVEFRARFRERTHHTLEIQVYAAAYRQETVSAAQADTAKHLSELWRRRGLPTDTHDYKLAQQLIAFAETLAKGEKVDLSPYAPHPVSPEWENAFFTIVRERRSVREFTARRVPDELITTVLDAGLWAAHSCNLQSIRYLVIREETSPGVFLGSDVPGGPVHLVVLQDERVYKANPRNPVRNRLLDAGAAAQNIVLAAHAVGLEGVWLTFNDAIVERLTAQFSLPGYVVPVTYVDVGYGDQTPYPVLRPPVEEMIIGRG
jgi:nitroreductase